jgi:K+-transporting ATPase KdpF subunit
LGDVSLRPFLRQGVTMINVLLLILCVFVGLYLLYAMLRPERF